MADRYLRATGNWNSTSTWSATNGGAAGASVPVADDIVYIASNYTVTLDGDATCGQFIHTNGTLNMGNYTLTLTGGDIGGGDYTFGGVFTSSGSTARTLNLEDGKIVLEAGANSEYDPAIFSLGGSNLSFNAGNSSITLNIVGSWSFGSFFNTASKAFNDVFINLGDSNGWESEVYLTGSPTFRSLIIQSKNSAAHTVTFDDFATATVQKLIAVGSSSSNKLTITAETLAYIEDIDSSYGQNVAMNNVDGNQFSGLDTPLYIGAGSDDGGSIGWILQDPPKISTLVDPLTDSPYSNDNWTMVDTITSITSGVEGGGYALTGDALLISTGTYDLVDSQIIFERPVSGSPPDYGFFGVDGIGGLSNQPGSVGAWSEIISFGGLVDVGYYSVYSTGGGGSDGFEYPISESYFYKIEIASSNIMVSISTNGVSWFQLVSASLTPEERLFFRSARILGLSGEQYIGSVNILPSSGNSAAFLQFF